MGLGAGPGHTDAANVIFLADACMGFCLLPLEPLARPCGGKVRADVFISHHWITIGGPAGLEPACE